MNSHMECKQQFRIKQEKDPLSTVEVKTDPLSLVEIKTEPCDIESDTESDPEKCSDLPEHVYIKQETCEINHDTSVPEDVEGEITDEEKCNGFPEQIYIKEETCEIPHDDESNVTVSQFASIGNQQTDSPLTSVPSTRKTRTVLSVKKRLEIIQRLENGEKVEQLAKEYSIQPNSVRRIRQNCNRLNQHRTTEKIILKRPVQEELDAKLYTWFAERRARGDPLTGPLIQEQALKINREMNGPETFKASCGWLEKFKKRQYQTDSSLTTVPSIRKKRTVLSVKKRLKIIQRLENGEKVEELAKEYDIQPNSVRRIRQNCNRLSQHRTTEKIILKRPLQEELDAKLYVWFVERRALGDLLTGPLIREQALKINREMNGSENFKASCGWLEKFKKRHGIRLNMAHSVEGGDDTGDTD